MQPVNLAASRINTYPGKIQNYAVRVRIKSVIGAYDRCDESLKQASLSISPKINAAGYLTTILSTDFENASANNNTMQFIDVNSLKNQTKFAIWDPSISSYSLSMTGGGGCKSWINMQNYTINSTIQVQLPNITFSSKASVCPQASYSLDDNVIGVWESNPLYPNKTGCSNVYDLSAPYTVQYKFLQVYNDTSGAAWSSEGSGLVTLSIKNPTLYCVQNTTSAICQNFASQTGAFIPANTKVTATDFAGFEFFAAPYFSPVCNPNVTDNNNQLYKASRYVYHLEISNYLLTRGYGLNDQWVPVAKAALKIGELSGNCVRSASDHPCGMGLGPDARHNQSHIHPWSVNATNSTFIQDVQWSNAPVPPSWTETTNDTRSALYVATYITADEHVPDDESVYFYACPWQNTVMGISFGKEGGTSSYGQGNNFIRGVEGLVGEAQLEVQDKKAKLGVVTKYEVKGSVKVPSMHCNEWTCQSGFTNQDVSIVGNVTSYDFDDVLKRSVFCESIFNSRESMIMDDLHECNPSSGGVINFAVGASYPGTGKMTFKILVREGYDETQYTQSIRISCENPYKNVIPIRTSTSFTRSGQDNGTVGLEGWPTVTFSVEPEINNVSYGVLTVSQGGSVSLYTPEGSQKIYDMEKVLVGPWPNSSVSTREDATDNVLVHSIMDYLTLSMGTAYEKSCGGNNHLLIDKFFWEPMKVYVLLMVLYPGYKSYWAATNAYVEYETEADGFSFYCSQPPCLPEAFQLMGNTSVSATTHLDGGISVKSLEYVVDEPKVENSILEYKVTIHRNDTSSSNYGEELDVWVMCPNPSYEMAEPASLYEFS